MKLNKLIIKLAIINFVIILGVLAAFFLSTRTSTSDKPAVIPKPNPIKVDVEGKTKVRYPDDYVLVLVGDSMTETLGNSDEIRKLFAKYYPGKTFDILNYGFGSTNILSLQKRLTEKTYHGREFRSITEIDFHLILIESFGHNPLSDYSLEEGLRKQSEILTEAVATIRKENPKAGILFVATLAPSKKSYGRKTIGLTNEQRKIWVEERMAYIENHIKFARENNIPLVNIYEKSLNRYGDVNLDYINKDDFIHPSPKGIIFISTQIAEFIYQNELLK
mgnify:CR=1 FL=1